MVLSRLGDPRAEPGHQGGGDDGRDHHPNAFTMWMAGGGVKPGISLGQTDEFGFEVIEDRVHVRDLHATILHLLGFDHHRLSVKFQGLDQRLTGVEPARIVDQSSPEAGPAVPPPWDFPTAFSRIFNS